jgi:hypothetical protein
MSATSLSFPLICAVRQKGSIYHKNLLLDCIFASASDGRARKAILRKFQTALEGNRSCGSITPHFKYDVGVNARTRCARLHVLSFVHKPQQILYSGSAVDVDSPIAE